MKFEGRKILKSLPMPEWFELSVVKAINSLAKPLGVTTKVTTLAGNGMDAYIREIADNIKKGKLLPSHIMGFKSAIRNIQDYLWMRFQLIEGGELLAKRPPLKADYDNKLIHIIEKPLTRRRSSGLREASGSDAIKLIETLAERSGSKDLKEIIRLAKAGKAEISVHKVDEMPTQNKPSTIPRDMPINVEGEEDAVEGLENLFNNEKGNLNNKKK